MIIRAKKFNINRGLIQVAQNKCDAVDKVARDFKREKNISVKWACLHFGTGN
jgi:hypothetical protein